MALEVSQSYKASHRETAHRSKGGSGLRTIIIGAGEAGRILARDLRRAPEDGLLPIGFLDDDMTKKGAAGLPVLGTTPDLVMIAAEQSAGVAIAALPFLGACGLRRVAGN